MLGYQKAVDLASSTLLEIFGVPGLIPLTEQHF